MRMLMNVKIPHQPFNAAVKDGTIGAKLNRILEAVKPEAVYFKEREIWWAHLGANIGFEQDGRHEGFERQVLSVKKLYGGTLLWALTLTTSEKKGDYHAKLEFEENGKTRLQWVILAQMRTISSKRLIRKVRTVSHEDFDRVMGGLKALLDK